MDSLQWFYTIHLKDICLGTKVYYFIYLTSLQRLRVVQNLYLHLFPNVWIFWFWKQRLSTGNPLPDVYKYLHVTVSLSWSSLSIGLFSWLICGSGLVAFFILAAYIPSAACLTRDEGTAAVIPRLSSQQQSCRSCLCAANLGFHCDPWQKTPQYVRWCGALHLLTLQRAAFGLLKLASFWLRHSTSHLGFTDPFLLACERRDCGAAFPKRELEPNFWAAGLSCASPAVLWHNRMLLQLEHFGNPVNDAAPCGVASTQLTGWNLLCLAWHWRK